MSNQLAQRAMLAQFCASCWGATKGDKKVKAEVALAHNISASKGNYSKHLMPEDAPEYRSVLTAISAARSCYYENTLPWSENGSRILASENYLSFAGKFRPLVAEFDFSVAAFVAAYPALCRRAQSELNSLWSANDYPADIRNKFDCRVSFMPLTTDTADFRAELGDAAAEAIAASARAGIETAMRAGYARIANALTKLSDKLSVPDAIFRDSLVENLADVCSVMRRSVLTDADALTTLLDSVDAQVLTVAPDTLRRDVKTRNSVATQAADLAASMSGMM